MLNNKIDGNLLRVENNLNINLTKSCRYGRNKTQSSSPYFIQLLVSYLIGKTLSGLFDRVFFAYCPGLSKVYCIGFLKSIITIANVIGLQGSDNKLSTSKLPLHFFRFNWYMYYIGADNSLISLFVKRCLLKFNLSVYYTK